jgi:PKD repeat protein
MYLGTGDGDAGDTYSIGVLKSTNGGMTWTSTGLTWTTSQARLIRKILINPNNTQIITVATNVGIYRSTNGGTTFTTTSVTNSVRDLEQKPNNPNILYACGTRFWRSLDAGATWTQITTGLPANTAVDRLAIAVTPADTNYIYMIASSATNSGMQGFYRSTNGGTSFTQVTFTSPANLLGWASNGNDAAAGGQGWYDLAIAASPLDKNEVVVGGVNVWRTTNGGTSWTIYGHWTGTGAPYIHADIHDLLYTPSGVLYSGNDGGVFYRTSTTWVDVTANMNIAQIYRVGLSASNASLMITGHQDNGTNRYNGTWSEVMGGDGMDCFIDRTNNQVMYGSQYSGSLNRSTNGGAGWTAITSGLPGGPWVTSWHQDPSVANTIYVGEDKMYKSTNQGTTWTGLAAMTGTADVVEFALAPNNNQVIYVIKGNALFKTINGGTSWTTITGTLPVGSAQMTYLAVDPTDANNVFVTFSGYSAGNKVFVSTNGGTSWTNISTGIPNLPVNCIVYQPGSSDGIYVGCDVGVYYRDNSNTTWSAYNTGLPNAPVFDLEIYQPTLKLRAATYGRGVWEVDAMNPGNLAPVADFAANKTIICPGNTVNFTDLSSFTPTSWTWTFQGGTPASSTAQSPSVVYNTPGTYSVQLVATNANGTDAETKTTYITVTGINNLPLQEGFVATTFPPTNWTTVDGNGDALFWKRSATVGFNSTNSMFFDNYNDNSSGARDEMQTPKYDFTGFSSASLTFDVAYGVYDATYSDTLAVLVSTDCGVTFTQVYSKGGSTLATATGAFTAAIFSPTATQWRSETVNLNAFVGQSNVMVVFQNRGRWGQALYVDNINITGVQSGAPPTAAFTSATAKCAGQALQFTDQSSNSPTSWAWSFQNGNPATSTQQNPSVVFANPGTYAVNLVSTNANGSSTPLTQTITVVASPTVSAVATNSVVCQGTATSITASGGTTYTWSNGSTNTTINVTPTTNTTYTVTGTTNGCSSTATQSITVNPLPVITTTGTNICAGQTANISASGGVSYSWSAGTTPSTGAAVTATPSVTTSYTVTGTGANGCTKNATVIVGVYSLPNVTATANPSSICDGASVTLTSSGATTYTWNNGSSSNSQTITPNASGTYSVTGTDANNCSKTVSVSVTVNSNPSVSITPSSTSICSGNSITLNVGGASTYTWDNGSNSTSILVSPSSSTTYSVTGTDTNNCSGTSSVNIIVNQIPTITFALSQDTLCLNSSPITLNANPLGGTFFGNGVTSSSFDPALSGLGTQSVSYSYTDSSGCSDTVTNFIEVSACSGILEQLNSSSFTLFPNPATEITTLVSKEAIDSYSLYDIRGRLILQQTLSSQKSVSINLKNMDAGNYQLVVRLLSGKTGKISHLFKRTLFESFFFPLLTKNFFI